MDGSGDKTPLVEVQVKTLHLAVRTGSVQAVIKNGQVGKRNLRRTRSPREM
jgi:hypothetical protein